MSTAEETKNKFTEKWNLNKIKNLTIEEYSSKGGKNRKDFTYDLEHNTPDIGSIRGGDSSKFKIYMYDKVPTKINILYDEKYAWHKSLGTNCTDAFQKVKNEIIKIIEFAIKKNFKEIENSTLFGDGIKWKIAFLYAEKGDLIDIFAKKALNELSSKNKIYEIQEELINNKPVNISIFDYSTKLWEKTKLNDKKDEIEVYEEKEEFENSEDIIMKFQPLNQILYGSPGTGKTYNTINKALEIIFEKENDRKTEYDFKVKDKDGNDIEPIEKTYNRILEINDEIKKRQHLKGLFEYFKDEQRGQIEFVTFHQSYGYEEFVEGIKAQTITDNENKIITYDIEAGIFKRLCEQAKSIKSEKKSIYDFDEKVNVWKISLGDSQNSEDDYLFNYCIENNKILLGFGNGLDFSDCVNRDSIAKKLDDNEKYSYPPTAINILKNKMKKDDIVLVSYGNRKLRAIAKIIGDYKYIDDDTLRTYVQSREVEWLLVPDEAFSFEKILKKQFSQMSIYDIKNNTKLDSLKNLLTQNDISEKENNKNYILIIDEINRGNISKIFGELITLIEPSKRIGADEEIRVKLPYSGDEFGVPQNLYIIGTMNTADRSIALMDTALRRRFHFEEMMPNPDLLKDENGNDLMVDKINIKSLLETVNKRIEYLYDRDHTIGHAYFMSLKDEKILDKKVELDNIFRNKIIPLLQEYFYDDWEKIQIVLGDHPEQFKKKSNLKEYLEYQFIQSKVITEEEILGFDHPDIENEAIEYKVNNIFVEIMYIKIYSNYPQIKQIIEEENKIDN
jgi:5-methylcytosine-specific restriction enzyme B